MIRYLNLEEVIYIYSEIIERTGGQAGIAEEKVLENVLEKPMVQFEGEEIYPDIFTKTAVLMYAMVNSRPFVDGNKRAALACTIFLLKANGYQIVSSQDNIVEVIKGTSEGKYHVDYLVNWLKRNTVLV
ncbi:MAG: type II toxin-antitoxin system death-on-curing family toxin [Veillonellaceae bacterium]|nr:type II toxin-antitoxin system death-on-curing family toxin [Veillonellaceae bacterium]